MQDLPGWDILANDVLFDEKSAIILLAFLSSHLTNVRRLVIFVHHFLVLSRLFVLLKARMMHVL